jgi:hypothetical protein
MIPSASFIRTLQIYGRPSSRINSRAARGAAEAHRRAERATTSIRHGIRHHLFRRCSFIEYMSSLAQRIVVMCLGEQCIIRRRPCTAEKQTGGNVKTITSNF